MKRYVAMLLALLMVLSLVGCKLPIAGQSSKEETKTTEADVTESETAGESTGEEGTDTEGTYGYEINPADYWAAFIALAEKYDGFEVGYTMTEGREVVAGGKGDTYWITEKMEDGSIYTHYAVGSGTDFVEYLFYTADGKTEIRESDENTLTRITENFTYLNRKHIVDNPVTPIDVENEGFACDRFNYDFGAVAYDIAKDYGITVRYSNVDDEYVGFALWFIRTGSDVEKMEKPEAGIADGDYDDPDYWSAIFGFNYCPFYVNMPDGECKTFHFRDGGDFSKWVYTEMNTEGWYYYNNCIITKDGKYAVQDFDDAFSSCCEYTMTPYDGPTLTEEEQAEIQKGHVYARHSWTPFKIASWYGIAIEGEQYPSEDIECKFEDLRADFADQEWISIYKSRLSADEEEEFLKDHAKLYAIPHTDFSEYQNGVLSEEQMEKALACCDYQLREDPEADDLSTPVYNFFIPNELDGEKFYGDVDLLFTYENVIAYYVVVTTHDEGWTP